MQQQLEGLLQNEKVQLTLHPAVKLEKDSNQQEQLTNKLLSEIQKFKNTPTTTPDQRVTYELYYTPELAKYQQLSQIADLEKRITELEKLLGKHSGAISGGNLVSSIEQIKTKLSLLDARQLDRLSLKVKLLSQDLDALTKKEEEVLQSVLAQQKINELYDIINRIDVSTQQLPTLISRLQSLKALHEESAFFVRTLKQLENEQQEISKLITVNNTTLVEVSKGLKSNFTAIEHNFSSLEKRIVALSSKLNT